MASLLSRPENIIAIAALVVVLVAVFLVFRWYERKRWEDIDEFIVEIQDEVRGGDFIDAEEFLASWIMGGSPGHSGFAGFKYADEPGCYVILVFDHEVEDGDWDDYDEVYVGQSVNMCQRVRNHLTGSGNGDVYADMRSGKHVYVQFNPCEEEELNDLEKALIIAYNATGSYNRTSGGSRIR